MRNPVLNDIQIRFFISLVMMWVTIIVVQPFTNVVIVYSKFFNGLCVYTAIACTGLVLERYGYTLLRSMSGVLAGLLFIMLPMVAINYMAMSFNMPLADDFLTKMDQAIGFDWSAFINYVDARPVLAMIFGLAYQSFSIQLVIVSLTLVFLGYHRRGHAFMIAYGLLTFLAAFIAAWFPAYGTYSHFGYVEGQMANINNHFGFEFINSFDAVRNSDVFYLSPGAMSGILTFPSVHAGVAYLLIWATWPDMRLRYPFLVLNIAMAISAVVNANHYLVDIIASIPLAVLSVFVVNCIFGKSSKPDEMPVLKPSSSGNWIFARKSQSV